MKFNILTLFPEVFSVFFNSSILKNAVEKGIISYNLVNFRNYSTDKHNRVDDYTYGGGKGMLISPDCVYKAYDDIVLASGKRPKMIYMSPRGKVLNQEIACDLAKEDELIILCGHYEGIDKRIVDELCDYELSVGDYVLTGGEIPAMILCDCVSRIVPGVLSSDDSFMGESHYNNGPLEYDQYTRPKIYNGIEVPKVLLSGNQKAIDSWREKNSKDITLKYRPDIYKNVYGNLPEENEEFIKINLLLLGATSLIKDEVMLQLNKNDIICENIYDENNIEKINCSSLVVLICGDYKVSVNKFLNKIDISNSLILNLRPFSSKRISPCFGYIEDTNYKPLKNFVTYSEFVLLFNAKYSFLKLDSFSLNKGVDILPLTS
jgi:tRNA (guanine37-N1)-methyltransferase